MVGSPAKEPGPSARRLVGRCTLAIVAAAIAGCAVPDEEADEGTRARAAEEWRAAIQDMGRFPVIPPNEDVYVGDVFALPEPLYFDTMDGFQTAATPRWSSLKVLALLEAEYRQRPSWRHTEGEEGEVKLFGADGVPVRHRIVGLRAMANLKLGNADLEPFIPIEIAPLLQGPATPERLAVSVQAGEAESYSLSIDTLTDQIVDVVVDGGQTKFTLKPEHLQNLPLVANSSTGNAYFAAISEVLYIRSIDATIRQRRTIAPAGLGPAPQGHEPGAQEDPMLAAIRRAAAMNKALAQSEIEDRIGGNLEFVTVTDDAITLRRRWPYPLAVAVRGVTLEVDVSTGEVVRMAPLGIELPALAGAVQQEEQEEESEVLEARRRGAKKELPKPGELLGARLYWDYGPRFDALDGELSIVAGGRLHLDAATFSEDEEIVAAFGEPDPGGNIRRAFLELGGAYRQFDFNLWLNFSEVGSDDSDVDFRNVFVGIRGIPAVDSLRVGYLKEPFGLEEITSSNDITFMERSLTDAFFERRNLGVLLQRRFTEGRRMTAALGVFRDADNELNTGDGYGVSARITGAPILAEDGRRALHLGAAATYRSTTDDSLRFRSRPESAQAQVMADTGKFAADREVRVGVEAGTVLGSLSLQTEAVVAASNGTAAGDPVFWSTYVMGSYVLTGEHRSYRDRVGAFGSVHPRAPLWRKGPGAIEIAARYSYLDLDSGSIQGGTLHDWTLGLNWYANQHARVMLNYIAAHPEGFGFEHILQARLQLTF